MRVLNSVLDGFLGTYTSRYSQVDGYWLFGFLVAELDRLEIDLLTDRFSAPETPIAHAGSWAIATFHDQLAKAAIPTARLSSARLSVERGEPATERCEDQWGYTRSGFRVHLHAAAISFDGRKFARSRTVFVAPHDPRFEARGGRPAPQVKL